MKRLILTLCFTMYALFAPFIVLNVMTEPLQSFAMAQDNSPRQTDHHKTSLHILHNATARKILSQYPF